MNKYVDYVIRDIGVPAHLEGYEALALCMEYKLEDYKIPVCKLYQLVATKMNKTYGAVERNIRHLVNYMLDKGDIEKIENYFGSSLRADGKLTNKQFIYTLTLSAKRIKFTEEQNNANNRR